MFILTESTPNPDALKFIPHARLTDGDVWSFRRADIEPGCSPLAERLFALEDVASVFVAEDFVTVTRVHKGRPWSALRMPVIAAIADHLGSGEPAVAVRQDDDPSSDDRDDLELQIREILARWVKPGVARDGGDVLFERFDAESGVLFIRMRGACGGCPSSRLTLKAGIERTVRRYAPEVRSVEEHVEPRPAAAPDWRKRLPGAAASGPGKRPVFSFGGRVLSRGDRTAS